MSSLAAEMLKQMSEQGLVMTAPSVGSRVLTNDQGSVGHASVSHRGDTGPSVSSRAASNTLEPNDPVGPSAGSGSNNTTPAVPVTQELVPGIGQAIDAIIQGEMPKVTPRSSFASVAIPLGSHLSEKTRSAIVADKFLDMATLLPNTQKQAMTLTVNPDATLGVAHQGQKPMGNVHQWNSAFQIYVAIYASAPHQREKVADLMKYAQTVQELDNRFGFHAARY